MLFFNSLAHSSSTIGTFAIGFALTPFLVHSLGFERYGLWITLGSIVAYVKSADIGIGSAFVKHIAEYAATGQKQKIRQVLTFGVLFYLALMCVMVPVALSIAPITSRLFRVSPAVAPLAPSLFELSVMAFLAYNITQTIESLLIGLGYLRVMSMLNFISRLIYAAAVYLFIVSGMGVYSLPIATFVQLSVALVLYYYTGRRLFGPMFTKPRNLEKNTIRSLFGFGAYVQVSNISSVTMNEAIRIIIAVTVQVASVTYYEIANKLTSVVRMLPNSFLFALQPDIASLEASDRREKVNDAYIRASRYYMFMALGLAGFIVAVQGPIIHFWMGANYVGIAPIVVMLSIGSVILALPSVGTIVLRAVGLPRYETYYSVFLGATSVAAMLSLRAHYGFLGIVSGALLASSIAVIYFMRTLHRIRDLSVREGLWSWFTPLIVAAVITVTLTRAAMSFLPLSATSRATDLGIIALAAILYMACFVITAILTRFFNASDLIIIRRLIPARLHRSACARRLIALVQGRASKG